MPTNAYATLEQVKTAVGVGDNDDDTLIELALNAASRQIDGHIGYRFWQDGSVKTREFYADNYRRLALDEGIADTAGLIVRIDTDGDGTFETTLTISTDFILKPTNAPDMVPVQPYTEIWLSNNYVWPILFDGRPGAQVTAKFGWPAVPDDVTMACVIMAKDLYKSKDSLGGSPELAAVAVAAINPVAKELLKQYRKVSVG